MLLNQVMNSQGRKKKHSGSNLPYLMWTHFVDFPSCVMSRRWCNARPILYKLIEGQEGVAELILGKTGPRESDEKLTDSCSEGKRQQARSPKS